MVAAVAAAAATLFPGEGLCADLNRLFLIITRTASPAGG